MRSTLNKILMVIAGLIVLSALYFHISADVNGFVAMINVVVFIIFIYISIYIHEIGHVLTGKLLRIETYSVIIGTGKRLWRGKIFGILFIVNTGWHGITTTLNTSQDFIKWRYFLYAAGGLLFQILIILSILFGLDIQSNSSVNIPVIFVASNIYLVIINLIPRKIRIADIAIPNDGLRLLKTPFMKSKDIQKILNATKLVAAHQLLEDHQYSSAAKIYLECIHDNPTLEIAHINYSLSLMKCLKFDEAKSVLIGLTQSNYNKAYDFLIYNNLAWLYLLDMNENSLHEADKLSQDAIELKQKVPSILSTRGCVLIELGRYDEGISMLENLTKRPIKGESSNALDFIYLACGYFQKGDKEKAMKYSKLAESYINDLAPENYHLYGRIKKMANNFNIT